MLIVRLVYIIARVVMGVISMVANLFTLVCALRKPSLRSAANMLVASLAVADFIRGTSTAVVMPSTYFFSTSWQVHHPLCLTGICIEAITLQLQFAAFCMIALERRNSLLFRLGQCEKWSIKRVLLILISLWTVIVLYNITMAVISSDVPEGTICIVRNYYPKFYSYIGVLSFGVTCVVITVVYGHIAWVAYKSQRQVATAAESSTEQSRRKKDMAITKMMAMVVGIFFVLYCPYYITASTLSRKSPRWHLVLLQVTVLFYDIIFWINPAIYAWRDKGFRKAFMDILSPCYRRCCGVGQSAVAPASAGIEVAVVGPNPVESPEPGPSTRMTLVPREPLETVM